MSYVGIACALTICLGLLVVLVVLKNVGTNSIKEFAFNIIIFISIELSFFVDYFVRYAVEKINGNCSIIIDFVDNGFVLLIMMMLVNLITRILLIRLGKISPLVEGNKNSIEQSNKNARVKSRVKTYYLVSCLIMALFLSNINIKYSMFALSVFVGGILWFGEFGETETKKIKDKRKHKLTRVDIISFIVVGCTVLFTLIAMQKKSEVVNHVSTGIFVGISLVVILLFAVFFIMRKEDK